MQSTQFRCLILIGVLAVGNWLQAGVDGPSMEGAARWPTEAADYAVPGWTVGPAMVEGAWGVQHVSRGYHRPDGLTATLTISTSPEAKQVYRAGADVPFLGSGYTVDPAPPSLAPPAPGRGALIVQRERELGLLLYAYGERRGLLGNGALGWSAAALDATLGRANDYYLVRLLAPLDRIESPAASAAVELADTLFPRTGDWYAG